MFEPIIGLEIHVQLKTKSKMFCSCDNKGEDAPPNTTICPVCMGHPGTLPVANAQAIRWTILSGLALGCEIPKFAKFDRKNYFYPDLPKGYQISQFDQPFCLNGLIEFSVPTPNGTYTKKVRITRIHLEEDAAKLQHDPSGKWSFVDYNRASTPLMEIVTEPDFRTPAEAKAFLQELRLNMRYLGVSEADMEKGHLRCDANISLRAIETQGTGNREHLEDWITDYSKLSPKTEIKNLNSFRSVERALEYEIKRQTKLAEAGQPVDKQSTRGWNDVQGITEEQRTKEEAHDYRYFPEPDIPPFTWTQAQINEIRNELPELPWQRRKRFQYEYGFTSHDAHLLVEEKSLSDYTEKVMMELVSLQKDTDGDEETQQTKLAHLVAGWLTSKLSGILNSAGLKFNEIKMTPEHFAELITLIASAKVNSTNAQQLLLEMVQTGGDPSQILEEKSMGQLSDNDALSTEIDKIISENPQVVAEVQSGKVQAIQFLVGQAMKRTKGRADPQVVNDILKEKLGINE